MLLLVFQNLTYGDFEFAVVDNYLIIITILNYVHIIFISTIYCLQNFWCDKIVIMYVIHIDQKVQPMQVEDDNKCVI